MLAPATQPVVFHKPAAMRTIFGFVVFGSLVLTTFAQSGFSEKRLVQSRMAALSGCVHDGRYYYERSLIPTVDSCINCKCENGMVRCNMTLCPLYPTIQEGCQLSHEDGNCCPQLVCDENAAKKLAPVPAIHDATLLGCTYNDFEFALGDFIPTSDPCQACYCIHNKTQCVHQNCALPESAREGCRPVYRHGICCPIRYDCTEALAAPATSRPPFLTEGCAVNSKLYDEGEAIPSGKSCEHCYCMKGEMICAMQKCDSPMAGCTPIIKDGQCCPERYECPNNTDSLLVAASGKPANLDSTNTVPLQSTTRGLEDELELAFQQTTSPSVTSPMTTIVPASTWIFGLPTITPTQARLKFVTGQTGGSASAWNSWSSGSNLTWQDVNHLSASQDDILPYNVLQPSDELQTKTGAVPTQPSIGPSEMFNSGDPLASNVSQATFASPNTDSSSMNISNPSQPLSVAIKLPDDNHQVIKSVSGSSSASGSSDGSELINLNLKVNISSNNAIKSQNAGSQVDSSSTDDGWKNLPPPGGNWTRKTILAAPLDPTNIDPIEGFLGFSQPSTTLYPLNFSVPDPSLSTDVEGVLQPPHADKLVVQVPYAHLTEVGLAGQPADPLPTDDVEGKLYSESPIIFESTDDNSTESTTTLPGDNSLRKALNSTRTSPLDPEPLSEVEGVLIAEKPGIRKSAVPPAVDPNSQTEVEGALSATVDDGITALSTTHSTTEKPILLVPADPNSGSVIEGLISTAAPSKKSVMLPPVDPSSPSDVEGALVEQFFRGNPNGTQWNITAVDPSLAEVVEGAIMIKNRIAAILNNMSESTTTANSVQNKTAVKDLNSKNAAGMAPGLTTKLRPVDPNTSDFLEGLLQNTAGRRVPFPAEPLLGDDVEGMWRPIPRTTSTTLRRTSTSRRPPVALASALFTEKTVIQSDEPVATTARPGTTLLSVKLDGGLPASLMVALAGVTRAVSTRPSTSTTSTSTSTEKLNIPRPTNYHIGLPWDPTSADDFEGQLHATLQGVQHQVLPKVPADPMADDQYEGIERPNGNLPTRVATTTIYTYNSSGLNAASERRNISWFAASTTTVLPTTITQSSSTTSTTTASTQPVLASTEEAMEGIKDVESVLSLYNGQNRDNSRSKPGVRVGLTNSSISTDGGSSSASSSADSWQFSDSNYNGSNISVPSAFPPGPPLSGIYENGCYFDGNYYRNYQSIPTNDLVDPCLVRLCKDGLIFGPSQQRCPPPIEGCFSTSIPGVCCPVYLCPNYLERNETSYTLTAATGDTLNTEKTKLALAKFCRVGPRFLALNERVVHVMGIQCQTCTCKTKGIVCEPGCAQGLLITTEIPPISPRRMFATFPTSPPTTIATTIPAITEPVGLRSCLIRKRRFHNGEEVTFNDPCHVCTCMDGLVICKVNKNSCRSAKILALDSFP